MLRAFFILFILHFMASSSSKIGCQAYEEKSIHDSKSDNNGRICSATSTTSSGVIDNDDQCSSPISSVGNKEEKLETTTSTSTATKTTRSDTTTTNTGSSTSTTRKGRSNSSSSSKKQKNSCRLWLAESRLQNLILSKQQQEYGQQHGSSDNFSSDTTKNILGLYSGISTRIDETLGGRNDDGYDHNGNDENDDNGQLIIPFYDANPYEYSLWHDVFWNFDSIVTAAGARTVETTPSSESSESNMSLFYKDLLLVQNYFHIFHFIPGIGSLASCHDDIANMELKLRNKSTISHSATNRTDTITKGSIAPTSITTESVQSTWDFVATQSLKAGQEIIIPCQKKASSSHTAQQQDRRGQKRPVLTMPLPILQRKGICLDQLYVGKSSINDQPQRSTTKIKVEDGDNDENVRDGTDRKEDRKDIGRGAFAKYYVSKGSVVITSPVLPLDRSQFEIVKQQEQEEQQHASTDNSDNQKNDGTFPKVEFTEHVQHHQLLLNYCFGHVNSTILLLPLAPGVNFINHAPSHTVETTNRNGDDAIGNTDRTEQRPVANVQIRWSTEPLVASHTNQHDLLHGEKKAYDVLHDGGGRHGDTRLYIDYVATQDIQPGDEILLDYGTKWDDAWRKYVSETDLVSDMGSSTQDQEQRHQEVTTQQETETSQNDFFPFSYKPFKTLDEQKDEPYQSNVMTVCYYKPLPADSQDNRKGSNISWTAANHGCLRPCRILQRENIDGKYYYTVQVQHKMINRIHSPTDCDVNIQQGSDDGNDNQDLILRTPHHAIYLVDKPYSQPYQQMTSFRHEIGLHVDKEKNEKGEAVTMEYPRSWLDDDEYPNGEFELPQLRVGQIEPIKWADTGSVVAPHAYLIGIPETVRHELLAFCDRLGITDSFRNLTYRGNGLGVGDEIITHFDGLPWYIQRPKWKSNLHWISPVGKEPHAEYLRALSAGGFDTVLHDIGTYFGFEGLACYHIAFISVSHSTGGHIHFDVDKTGGRAFSMIIPLMLVDGTSPELGVQGIVQLENGSNGTTTTSTTDEIADSTTTPTTNTTTQTSPKKHKLGRLKYRYDVASMMGDHVNHATSAVDYRIQKSMRMAATVYIADVQEDNVHEILAETQNYPPRDRPDILWSLASKHWKRNDPSVKLPSSKP